MSRKPNTAPFTLLIVSGTKTRRTRRSACLPGRTDAQVIRWLTPVCERLREQGFNLIGPLPADTLFTPKYLQQADGVMSMFHDQGLPVLKYSGFGEAVNVTLGLPFIRTSVDHGTALDIAGSGTADTGSLVAALGVAAQLITNKELNAPS